MGSREFKDELVQDLVQFFTTDKSKLSGGKLTAGSELFEPGDLPTGDGSVTTYKDIVNLASEVGNPSLVYRFMSLASDKAMWTSRAAFGRFGLSNILSDSNVGGYLAQNPKLYPKLYRYMFDPNTNVQASMKSIWNVLVKDPNAVIDTNFDAIMEELLSGMMNGKEWRVRQASCSAMANLIQSRQVEKYDKYLKEILTKTFKVIDDIKGSVRLTALKLGQTLSAIVIRTLEKGETQSKRATLMLDHIVPFLLGRDGLESAADEVRAFSILTLRDIIRKSPGKALSPYVPQILETFLMNLSSLESQIANYLHLNADKYGMTGQDVDKLRLSGLRSSPIMEVIESHLLDSIDEKSMKEVAERLQNVLRSAIGMPSKVACSRVLAMLSRKPILFKPYADRFLQLARTHALDRNETIGASYSTAMGYMGRIASDEQILKTIDFTKSLYFNSQEDSHRSIAAEILNCLSKHASDRVSKLAAAFLPLVFIGKHDTDAQIREDFDKVWNDNVSGSRMVMLYLNEILELVSVHIESPKWAVKHACALSSAGIVTSLGDPIDPKTAALLWPVIQKAIGGKSWEGKGTVFEGVVRFAERTRAFWSERQEVSKELTVSLKILA
jgi:proteasome component ECM29